MTQLPPRSTLFPYTTLFRSIGSTLRVLGDNTGSGAGNLTFASGFSNHGTIDLLVKSEVHTIVLHSLRQLVFNLLHDTIIIFCCKGDNQNISTRLDNLIKYNV